MKCEILLPSNGDGLKREGGEKFHPGRESSSDCWIGRRGERGGEGKKKFGWALMR
jgi:hypothetical protein